MGGFIRSLKRAMRREEAGLPEPDVEQKPAGRPIYVKIAFDVGVPESMLLEITQARAAGDDERAQELLTTLRRELRYWVMKGGNTVVRKAVDRALVDALDSERFRAIVAGAAQEAPEG